MNNLKLLESSRASHPNNYVYRSDGQTNTLFSPLPFFPFERYNANVWTVVGSLVDELGGAMSANSVQMA